MNNIELVAILKNMVKEKYGYVWGAVGELYTPKLAESWKDQEGRGVPSSSWDQDTYYTVNCAKWFNHRVVDCSGMIVAAVRTEKPKYKRYTTQSFYANNRRQISSMPELEGIFLYRKGHIGIYIGSGKLIEAKGTNYGVVISDFKQSQWTHWGLVPEVEYPRMVNVTLPQLRKGMENESVRIVQLKLGIQADSIFGTKTEVTVKKFQESRNLDSDGIIGINTWREIFR